MAQPKLSFTGYNKLKQSRYGPMLFNKNDVYVGGSFDNYGEFSREEIEFIISKTQGLFLDIGANIGAVTIPVAKAGFEVHAFEPQLECFKLLCANIALNSLANATPYQLALGSSECKINIPMLDPNAKNNFGGLEINHGGTYPVHQTTIDLLNLPTVDFMKIDVEGMEEEVLRGAVETIKRCRPKLYVENDRAANSASLLAYLTDLGYNLERHAPPLYSPSNYYGNKENLFGNIVSINVYAEMPSL